MRCRRMLTASRSLARVREEARARVWADVLGVARVGVHDNYFALGGDSIKAIQIAARAEGFGRESKLIAKGAGEGFVRSVPGIEGDGENIGRARGENSGGFR